MNVGKILTASVSSVHSKCKNMLEKGNHKAVTNDMLRFLILQFGF